MLDNKLAKTKKRFYFERLNAQKEAILIAKIRDSH